VQDLKQRSAVAQNSPLVGSLGTMLLSLALLVNTMMCLVLAYILSLLWLTMWMLKKLVEQLKHIVLRGWNALYTSCRWVDVQKATISLFKKLQSWQWRKGGDSHQDSTLAYSEMPGELDKVMPYTRGIHTEEQFNNLRKDL
jgi:hypothetical protein